MAADLTPEALAASPEVKGHLRRADAGVYIVRANGEIVWASPSMHAITGVPSEELVGGNGWAVLVRPEDVPQVARFKALLSVGDGTIWMQLRPKVVHGKGGWYRVDTWVRDGYIVCAFHPEPDPALHYLHHVHHPRPEDQHPDEGSFNTSPLG